MGELRDEVLKQLLQSEDEVRLELDSAHEVRAKTLALQAVRVDGCIVETIDLISANLSIVERVMTMTLSLQ